MIGKKSSEGPGRAQAGPAPGKTTSTSRQPSKPIAKYIRTTDNKTRPNTFLTGIQIKYPD